MTKYCCICERDLTDEDYDRVGQDYYCLRCSNNNLVPCVVCEKMLNPNTDTKFQGPDGHLFCSQDCMNTMVIICMDCGCEFYTSNEAQICPLCLIKNYRSV